MVEALICAVVVRKCRYCSMTVQKRAYYHSQQTFLCKWGDYRDMKTNSHISL